jgi:hypothetical protein
MKLGISSSALQDSILTKTWFNERNNKRSTEGTAGKANPKVGVKLQFR